MGFLGFFGELLKLGNFWDFGIILGFIWIFGIPWDFGIYGIPFGFSGFLGFPRDI